MYNKFYLGVIIAVLVCVVWLGATGLLADDQVRLKSGEVLKGKVNALKDEKLELATSFAGTVKIKTKEISLFSMDKPLFVRINGDKKTVKGRILIRDDKMILAPLDGTEQEIKLTDIRDIRASLFKDKWTFSLEGSAQNTISNNKIIGTSSKFKLVRKEEVFEFRLSGLTLNNKTDGKTTLSQHRGEAKLEYDLKPKFYAYIQEIVEDNKTADLNLRTQTSGGLGYYLFKQDEIKLSFDMGTSYSVEDYENVKSRERTSSLRLVYDFWWGITKSVILDQEFEYLPKISDFDEYRTRIETNFKIHLTKNVYTNWGMIHEYNSTPPADVRKHLATYLVTIGLKY